MATNGDLTNSSPSPKFTFPKSARLSRRKYIQNLFDSGKSFFVHPLKVIYLSQEDEGRTQVLFSVPKKIHKSAVSRNKVKRLLKEAYRLNQELVNPDSDTHLFIAYIYMSREILSFKKMESKLIKSIHRLNEELQAENEK